MIATAANFAVEPISAGQDSARDALSSSTTPNSTRLHRESYGLPPALSEAELKSLLRRLKAAASDDLRIHVRDQLVLGNLWLVYKLADDNRQLARRGNDLNDLRSEGIIALIENVARCDTLCIAEFYSFITKAVKFAMLGLYHSSNPHGLRRHASSDVSKLRRILRENDGVSDAQAAAAFGDKRCSIRRIQELKNFIHGTLSLDSEAESTTRDRQDGSFLSLKEVIADPHAVSPAAASETHLDSKAVLDAALDVLSPRERDILERVYGLHGRPKQFAREIAVEYGLSRPGVEWVVGVALKKMKAALGARADV